jgi:UDP-glucose 4-epimerase
MNILITGAGGFIGSTLMDALSEHRVIGFDNFLTGRSSNNHDVIEMDIRDRDRLYLMANELKPELIIHCAASYKDPNLWHQDTDINVNGAINVAAVAKHHNARIIYFQTVLPPISSYAISKIAGEHYLRLSGQPLTVFRLAAVYGPRNLSGAIPTFYRQVKAGLPCTVVEDATRDFVFVEDLVERVKLAAENPHNLMNPVTGATWSGQATMDIHTGVETRILEIPGMIGQLLETEAVMKLIPRPSHDVPHYDMDAFPLKESTPFHIGLKKAVEWYEQNGVGETFTHLVLEDD